ncbi:hypothetical protein [Nocardia xishanensis]|uniref:Secreted protein n=1 Tax=Nocardia xishanensis TaxID=238964 RepID=A0ABW7X611_9NOCA
MHRLSLSITVILPLMFVLTLAGTRPATADARPVLAADPGCSGSACLPFRARELPFFRLAPMPLRTPDTRFPSDPHVACSGSACPSHRAPEPPLFQLPLMPPHVPDMRLSIVPGGSGLPSGSADSARRQRS